jgi:hypothetical protein
VQANNSGNKKLGSFVTQTCRGQWLSLYQLSHTVHVKVSRLIESNSIESELSNPSPSQMSESLFSGLCSSIT